MPNYTFNDLTGKRFGRLLVIERAGHNKHGQILWLCKCDCGKVTKVISGSLTDGRTTSCGCLGAENRLKANLKEIKPGQRFGRLTVSYRVGSNISGQATWYCNCDCGGYTIASGSALRSGHTKSCGCISRGKTRERALQAVAEGKFATKTHGLSGHVLYRKWANMINRCYNPKDKNYKNYGGKKDHPTKITKFWYDPDRIPSGESIDVKGLKEFIRWAYDEGGFYDQPKDTPHSEMLSIERKDPNGDYCPENCTFIPLWKQQMNKRNTMYLYTEDGKRPLVDVAKDYNIDSAKLRFKYLSENWHNDAIIYSAKHQDEEIHRTNEHVMYPYLNKDGFGVLIPTINNKFFKDRENKNNI